VAAEGAKLPRAPDRGRMRLQVFGFFLADRSNADRGRRRALAHAAHDAGVTEPRVEIALAHVAMRVELEYGEPGKALARRGHGAGGDAVLPAEHRRNLALIEDPSRRLLDAAHHFF